MKEAKSQKNTCVRFHLEEMWRIDKFIETRTRSVVARI